MKKKEKVIIDTGVLVNYFLKKEEKYRKIINEIYSEKEGLTLYLNLTELYYVLGRIIGKEASSTVLSLIKKSPIKILSINENLSIRAGELKLSYDFLSIVDSYLVALAEREKAKILTTDSSIAKAFKDTDLLN
ncbi:PIN domain-containing protein [Acidianus manzaensis]|uniref:PIN domain-containing protein n=1 Tax=Acidianus manzaensis TaxID=282676 RepID=UPI001F2D1865|nr:PIN domain-containing protein [Acidianus manzaensis]